MRRKRLFSLLAILTSLISLTTVAPIVQGDGPEGFSVPEKQEQEYPNLGSQLNQLVASVEEGQLSAKQAAADSPIHSGGSVAVTIHLSGNVDDVVQFLEDNGGDPRNVGEDYIEAYVPVALLGQLSQQPGVTRVREIVPPEPSYGEYVSQGVQTHLSHEWNDAGYSGQGVKVGVIDLGFEGLRSLMGSELPSNIQGRCYTDIGTPTDDLSNCEGVGDVSARFPECQEVAERSAARGAVHGAAVAESLVDIAPGASLYIANPISRADLQDTVQWMAAEGVSVINYSVSYIFDGPGDGTSPSSVSPLNTVDQAVASDILWVNSAGNDAEGTWFGRYSDPDGDGIIGFGDQNDEVIDLPFRDCRGYRLQLRWEDSWEGAVTDLDLHFVDKASGLIVVSGDDVQSGESGQVPHEWFGIVRHPRENLLRSTDFGVVVSHEGGPVPDWIQLEVSAPGAIEHYTVGGSIANPAESANPGMLAVGAAHYWETDTAVTSYSSQGPTPDGRVKPDIVGTDCGETVSYPHYSRNGQDCWFSGTSQASPHVAGLAALVKQRFPGFTPDQVADYLKHHAEQREAPDPNNTWGHGFAVLPPPGTELPPDFESSCGGTITADSTVQGQWTKDCNSETPAPGQGGSGARLARYYTFTLTESADVSVTLESQDAETVLYLREGTGVRSGDPIESNEGESEYNYRRASIQRSLDAATYTIEATTYDAGDTGSFTLSLSVTGESGGPPPVSGDCGIADISTDGSPVTGSWSDNCESDVRDGRYARYYQFTLSDSTDVTVLLESQEAEIVLYLRQGAGATSGDTVPDGFNEGDAPDYHSASLEVSLAAGTYTIEATTYAAGETGSFTLTVSGAGETTTPPVSGDCEAAEIEADGSPVPGTWGTDCVSDAREGRQARYYQFALSDSADITVLLESQEAETVLYLRQGAGATSGDTVPDGFNEGDAPDYHSASLEVSLAAGTYTIEATTYAAGETGSFTLTVSGAGETTTPPVSGDCGIAEIADYGIPVTGSWSNDCQSEVTSGRNARYYKFTLAEDAEVTIELRADADEPVLHLRDGDSKTGTEIDKHEGFQDEGYKRAEIVKELEAGKTYTIEARTYREGYEGPFTLTVTVAGATGGLVPTICQPADIAPNGAPLPGTWGADCLSDARQGRQARYFQFALAASADITVLLESNDAEPVLYLRQGPGATSGNPIAINEGEAEYNYRRAIIRQTLAPGTYTVEATTYNADETGNFTVTVCGAGAAGGVPVAAALAPLGDNLLWVTHHDNATGTWSLYDPSGTFSLSELPPNGRSYSGPITDLTHLFHGAIYVIKVAAEQTVALGGVPYTLYAGVNIITFEISGLP